jgi:hypothetical protein
MPAAADCFPRGSGGLAKPSFSLTRQSLSHLLLKSHRRMIDRSLLNNPLLRRKQSAQEVRSVENAPTWRQWREQHPQWHICCPHSNRPHGNGCGQGSCCRDDSSRLSCSRATDDRF